MDLSNLEGSILNLDKDVDVVCSARVRTILFTEINAITLIFFIHLFK